MGMKRTIRDFDWQGKRALVRVDFNVPFERGTTRISDDVRIREAVPTIEHLLGQGAAVVLCTHLGRPDGKRVPDLELGPVVERLSEAARRACRLRTRRAGRRGEGCRRGSGCGRSADAGQHPLLARRGGERP